MNDNETRADCAERALEAHAAAMTEAERGGNGESGLNNEALYDLLTDLRHWADQQGLDYGAADQLAEMNHEAETDPDDVEYGGAVVEPRQESQG